MTDPSEDNIWPQATTKDAMHARMIEILHEAVESGKRQGRHENAAELSAMLFDAREIISMYADVVVARTGQIDAWLDTTIRRIDSYRAERGWSPDGHGGEDE